MSSPEVASQSRRISSLIYTTKSAPYKHNIYNNKDKSYTVVANNEVNQISIKNSASSSSSSSSALSQDFYQAQTTLKPRQIVPMSYSYRAHKYTTGDVLIIDNDSMSSTIIFEYLRRVSIKMNSVSGPMRHLTVQICSNGNDAINRILNKMETYAFIIIDQFLGPRSPDGREVIRCLREGGYKGAIVYVSSTIIGCTDKIERHLLSVGADGILFKGTETLKEELNRLIKDLVVFAPCDNATEQI